MNPAIQQQVARLGCIEQMIELNREERSIEGYPIPDPILEFIFGVIWPKGIRYRTRDYFDPPLTDILLDQFDWIDPEELPILDRDHRPLISFGDTNGGNKLLILALDDPDIADPQLFVQDHDDPEQRLKPQIALSRFLALLEPESPR